MNAGWIWRKFPILLALVFCLYAVGLISRNLEAQRTLKNTEISRVIDLNTQLAATFGDYLAEQTRFVADLAHGAEISNYRANKALGMSPRYGLQASLDSIGTALRKILSTRQIGGQRLYARFAFIDGNGRRLIDTETGDNEAFTAAPGMTILSQVRQARLVTPLSGDTNAEGCLVAWIDLTSLTTFLLPRTFDSLDLTILLYPGDSPDFVDPELLRKALLAPPGQALRGKDPKSGTPVILTIQPVPSTPLRLASLREESSLEGGAPGYPFLILAAILPLLTVAGAIGYERFQARHARMQAALESSRQRLLTISDNLIEGIVMTDGKGTVLSANRAAAKMLKCDDTAPGIEGRAIDELMRMENGQPLPWREALHNVGRRILDDIRVTGGQGMLDVTLSLSPLTDAEAGLCMVIAFRDIKPLKEAQRQLMQNSRLAAIGQLAAGIAHEINTPAQYVISNLHFLGSEAERILQHLRAPQDSPDVPPPLSDEDIDFLCEEVPQAIQESRIGMEQISHIVHSMKEFSHPGGTNRAAADLNKAIKNTLTVSRNAWKLSAAVACDLQDDLPPVTCREAELNQVFLNLIVNAAQAIEASGKPLPGQIRISSRADGEDVEIRVSDNGCGIAPDIADKIFDPFFTTKSVGKGTGQGLAISNDIITVKHGGSLTVDSTLGEGTTFVIRIPIGNEGDDDPLQKADANPSRDPSSLS